MKWFKRKVKESPPPVEEIEPVAEAIVPPPKKDYKGEMLEATRVARNQARILTCLQNMQRLQDRGMENTDRYKAFEREWQRRTIAAEDFINMKGGSC